MTEEEKKELENKSKELKELIEKTVGEKMEAATKELKEIDKRLAKAEAELVEKTESIKGLQEKPKTEDLKEKGIDILIHEAIADKADELKSIKGKGGKIVTKLVGDITRANVSSLAPFYSTDTDINMYPSRMPFLRNIINVGTTTGAYHQWYEQGAGEGDAGMTDENTPKKQRDQDWTLANAKVEKITAFTKVTEEALEDVPFIEDAIRTDLIQKIQLKEDAQILAGSGTGTPTQLKGILEYSTAFSVTNSVNSDFYHNIQDANDLDVLRVAIAIIAKSQGVANTICLNPVDVALMDLSKTTNGSYILPPFTTANGTNFKGCRIIENTGITAGTFLVMDSTKSNYKVRKELVIAIGYDDDDFTNNRITIRGELRGVHYIKANDKGCFVDGTFTACKAMITSGAATQNVAIVSPLNGAETAVSIDQIS